MRKGLRTMGWVLLTAAATYVVAEWSVLHKSGLHDLRAAEPVVAVLPVEPMETERVALQAQFERLERTFGQYRAAKDRQIADLLKLIANLERQIQVLTAQRAPVEQVAALRAASQPVRWTFPARRVAEALPPDLAAMARAIGFTRVEVRR